MLFPFFKKQKTKAQEKIFDTEVLTSKDIIAPGSIKVNPDHINMAGRLAQSFFVFSYPRYLSAAWLAPVINLDIPLDISMFVHPIDTGLILKQLRRRVTEVQSELMEKEEKGYVRDPALETAFQDLEQLRDRLQTAQERMFRFGLYITAYGNNLEELRKTETTLRSIFESRLIYIKPALYQQKEGFNSCLPYGRDFLQVHTSMNTEPLSSTFPFVSFDLSSNDGILYGVNMHNNSLILFDRFSMDNYNETIFARSGSGKSVLGSEPVLVKQGGNIRLTPIGTLVDSLIAARGAIKIDEELEGVINPGLQVYSFDKSLHGSWSNVTVAARKEAPREFYAFTTKSGRKIVTTGDHNMVVLQNGAVVAAKSSEIARGECIPVPREISSEHNKDPLPINLLELLRDEKRLYVRGGSWIFQTYKKAMKQCLQSRYLHLQRYHCEYAHGRAVPLPYFLYLLRCLHINIDNPMLSSVVFCSKNSKTKYEYPVHFVLDSYWWKVMGYLIAEGTFTAQCIIFSNTDAEVLGDMKKALQNMKVPFYCVGGGIAISSQTFIATMRSLGCMGNSRDKRIPPLFFAAGQKEKAAFLSAYFEGDGGVEKTCFISATSKSSALISDISYGLLSFGIIGRIKRRKKMCTNGTMRKRRSYYTISISGQKYLRQFAEHIGFVSERKCGLLWSASQKKGNTNVDTIPGLAPLFSELYKLFGFQLSNVHDFINIKNGVFNPSPELLRFVCSQIEERILAFKKLGDKLNILGTLPEFQEIAAEARANSALNKTLWHTLGSSWYTAGYKGMPPFCKNALAVIQMTRGLFYSLESIKENIRSGFRATGVHLKHFHPGLQYALVEKAKNDTQYRLIQQSSYFVWQKYQDILLHALPRAEQILHQLKALACADLFWDPIVAIQKTENKKEKYVYDLTVDNEVFVAGRGGMFVHNSYAVKLEILRSLMMGTDVIVLDPENEYKTLSEAVGGSFFDISLSSENHINPFDLPQPREDEKPEDILRSNIINFVGLMRIMLGGLTSEEDSVMDRALAETYAAKDITPESDPATWNKNIPLIEDLQSVLETMEGAESLVRRMKKFTQGTYANFFNKPTNVSFQNKFTVFGIRDMEETLRPMAMYIIMRYIWNQVRSELKKRIFVIDEAWWMMQSEDGASFLYGIVKRARKYFLGVTTITQDVGDFMKSEYGKPIVNNSSIQLLMKQSPSAIEVVQKTFNLTSEEKNLLLETEVGEGIFLAGQKRVAIKVVASPTEHEIVTTAPEEIIQRKSLEEQKQSLDNANES